MPRILLLLPILGVLTANCGHAGHRLPTPSPKSPTLVVTPAAAVVAPLESTPVGEPDVPPRLVVSELMVDPLMLEDAAGEYVELANMATLAVRLADVGLVMPNGQVLTPERPSRPWLQPGEVLLLTPHGKGEGEAKARGMKLPNIAGRVEVRWRGRTLDVVQWYRKRPWPKAEPGRSLERTAPTADGRTGASWRLAREVLRGVERGSPGKLAWPCELLVQSPLHAACLAAQRRCGQGVPGACREGEKPKPTPKTRNRAPQCSAHGRSLGGDLNPRPSDYESLALTT